MNDTNMKGILALYTRAIRAENTLEIIRALLKSDQYVSTEKIAVIIDAAFDNLEVDADAE